MEISVCLIIKDEEEVLERCLKSIESFADEIIIVDTGSIDNSKSIALQFSEKVYDFEWCDDFSKARNYAFSKANKPYIMWLDADDYINSGEIEKILNLKENMDGKTDIYMCYYDRVFDKDKKPIFSFYRERIIRNHSSFVWTGKIHEVIVPKGMIEYTDIHICHGKVKTDDKDRNIRIYEKMLEKEVLNPRDQYYYARELYDHKRYKECIDQLHIFLSGEKGWLEDNIQALQLLSNCYLEVDQPKKAIRSLFYSFIYDKPRAEICCSIGKYFLELERYEQAIYWYYAASRCIREDGKQGFIQPDAYDFTPYIQLCVCYDRIGQHEKAQMYNDMAGSIKPQHPSYLHNKEYFEQCLGI